MLVAVCFFGLTRSLRHTLPSIRRNIFAPLAQAGFSYDVFLHTYNLTQLTNRRAREFDCELDPEEWRLLEPLRYIIDNQKEFDAAHHETAQRLKLYGDAWRDDYVSFHNLLRQLNSLKRVTELWQGGAYDVILYLRPDLDYHDSLDVALIQSLGQRRDEGIIVTAEWQQWRGLNDRFAYCTPSAAQRYGNRMDECEGFCTADGAEGQKLHSERLLAYAMRNVQLEFTSSRATRVRANGRRRKENFRPERSRAKRTKKVISINANNASATSISCLP
jgi:hypothetical protein